VSRPLGRLVAYRDCARRPRRARKPAPRTLSWLPASALVAKAGVAPWPCALSRGTRRSRPRRCRTRACFSRKSECVRPTRYVRELARQTTWRAGERAERVPSRAPHQGRLAGLAAPAGQRALWPAGHGQYGRTPTLKQPAMIRAKLAPVQVRTERFQAVLSGFTSAYRLANRPA
jgi:hypothetical protein